MSLEALIPGDVLIDGRVQSHVLRSNEILTEIVIPPPKSGAVGTFQKIRPRGVWDFAMASVAVNLEVAAGRISDARVIFGGIAVAPYREHAVEAYLKGKPLGGDLAREAAARALLKAAPLKYNDHKVDVARGALASGLDALAA
jgi:xanthine dehydrogenase YagS FAD-binding subunit